MKLHFAHLDKSWKIIGYDSNKNTVRSECFALTNIGIQISASMNIMFSIRNNNGIYGRDFIKYLYALTPEFLFQRQLESTSSRSGSFRGRKDSKGIEMLRKYNTTNILKKNMLDRIDPNKYYVCDEDLYFLGDGIFTDAQKINPILACCFSEIRECKFRVPRIEGRTQARDYFKTRHLKKLLMGEIILEQTSNNLVIPEYGFYLDNIDKKKNEQYILITKEKNMSFSKNNNVRANGRTKNIIKIVSSNNKIRNYSFDYIMSQLINVYGENLDITNPDHRNNVRKTLAKMVKSGAIRKNKADKYFLTSKTCNLIVSNKDEICEEIKNQLNKMHSKLNETQAEISSMEQKLSQLIS